MIGANAGIHLTALFTDICFTIDGANMFQGGWPALKDSCLITSLILLGLLVWTMLRDYHPFKRKESWISGFSVLVLLLALLLDGSVADTPQPVSFLTIAIVISSVLYYIWLHFQFVRTHENALATEQRIQIMMTQIQPHFLYNTLATIRGLCLRSPELAAQTIDKFSRYLRQNLDTLNQPELIPFTQELEHVRIYAEIEMLMFPYIHINYAIGDDCFMLPPLTVQPLVENAIRHGVRAREVGQIDITVRKEENGHTIVIADNGLGFDPATIDAAGGKHIGLRNVRERLEKQCGGTLSVESRRGEGTTVTVFVPVMADGPGKGDDSLFGKTGMAMQMQLKNVGVLIEHPGLYPRLSAYENLKIKCIGMGIKPKGYVENLLKTVGLENTDAKKGAGSYSLGMRQRLGIGLALVGDPKLIILDEPINGLDPQGIVEVREMLSRLRDERGITIMISSHILEELGKIADSYGVIHEGTLLDEFSAEELHERCGKSLVIRTDDTAGTLRVLENMGLRGAMHEPDGSLRIGRGMEQAKEISKAIVNAGIGLEEIYLRTMSLEEYYLGMTGGEHNG